MAEIAQQDFYHNVPSILQMLADLMFRKNEYDSAMFHFQQLLQHKAGIFLVFRNL